MRKSFLLLALAAGCSGTRQSSVEATPPRVSAAPAALATSGGPPPWAYGFAAAAAPATGVATTAPPAGGRGGAGGAGGGGRGAAAPDTTRHRALGSSLSFTLAQVRDAYGPADWFPAAHGEMPPVVKSGRRDAQILASAADFGAIRWSPWIKVVEADAVPKTRIAAGMFIPFEGAEAGTEPIGQQIIEVPENTEQTETLRNSRSGFVAYVPRGSLARGEAISARAQCALCHGANLSGLGPVPGIAGRSPSYIVRQLYDFQSGARKGHWGELMKSAVATMSADDMIAVAAYAASRAP